jgi:hypothetical protein
MCGGVRIAPALKFFVPFAIGAFIVAAGRKGAGSPTNASDAVDDIKLGPDASHEDRLDAGVEETFPASDPVFNSLISTSPESFSRSMIAWDYHANHPAHTTFELLPASVLRSPTCMQ